MYKLKNDNYRRQRGGKAEVYDVYCTRCNEQVLTYQKDGIGRLLRLYLNRILAPPELERLQREPIRDPHELSDLVCGGCETVLATPIQHIDGRFALLIRQGFIRKERYHGEVRR